MLTANLKSHIDRLWDRFWSGGISNPLNAIEQITYLLFMKQLDQLDSKRKKEDKSYRSIFLRKENMRWSNFPKDPNEMLFHVKERVFPFIKNLKHDSSGYAQHMSDAEFRIRKSSLMVDAYEAIDRIYEEIEIEARDKSNNEKFGDTQGDVYEYLLSELRTAGKMGQFRTPPHIIQLVTHLALSDVKNSSLIKPDFRIVDPACGSAGFLLAAYRYILTRFTSPKLIRTDDDGFKYSHVADKLTKSTKQKLHKNTFYGFDIDLTMLRISVMNLLMHGITQPRIEYKDTLSKKYNEDEKYDLVLANPPFKGSIDKNDINGNLTLQTDRTELLFLERIYRMLKIGGTACIIVPQGVLFGSQKAFKLARHILLDRCDLKAVISMPDGVFRPYAGVATAILVFTKKYKADREIIKTPATQKVWFYNMESDGYSLDDKRIKLKESDLQDITEQFGNRLKISNDDKSKRHFFVSYEEIMAEGSNLSFNRYFEGVFEKNKFRKPSDILQDIKLIEKEIQTNLQEIENYLNEA